MTVQTEAVAAAELVGGGETTLHSHAGGGAGPALQGSVSVDLPSIAKASTADVDVAVTGLLTTHKVYVQCQNALESGLVCIAAYCSANGTLRLRITNWSSAAIDGAARIWAYQAYA
jgi:hypothetical protein